MLQGVPRKLAAKTRIDRVREKEDVKLLVFAGAHGVREAARIVGVNEQTALSWAAEERWTEQLTRIKELARKE